MRPLRQRVTSTTCHVITMAGWSVAQRTRTSPSSSPPLLVVGRLRQSDFPSGHGLATARVDRPPTLPTCLVVSPPRPDRRLRRSSRVRKPRPWLATCTSKDHP